MKYPLFFKALAIGLLMLLLLIPLAMIDSSIDERRHYNDAAVGEIARSSSLSQTLRGPVLVVPFNKKERNWVVNAQGQRSLEESLHSGNLYFLPDDYQVNATLSAEIRLRGIYKARLYHVDATLGGHFNLPANYGIEENPADYEFFEPYISVGISDTRGIEKAGPLLLKDQTLAFEPGAKLARLGAGVSAGVGNLQMDEAVQIPFSLTLAFQGTEQLHIVPIGKETRVALRADWPHPSFVGNFLPVERKVEATGFSALWRTNYFSTNVVEVFNACVLTENCTAYESLAFGVNLIDPVNHYVKSDRAIKYALLFIVLTFAGFFLFEVLKRLQIHPMQYGLVGLSLAIFYLLLVSLSEHTGFTVAYVVSSMACVSLIGFYVSYVLRSLGRGLGFALALAALYGLLYGLLSAEDYALLMGGLLLFALLGTFMVLTRNVDWYKVSSYKKSSVE